MGYPHADSYDEFNRQLEQSRLAEMATPVRCTHCGGVYDLGAVEVTARYVDCSVWKSPCCRRTVDDRGPGWTPGGADYERLDPVVRQW